VRFPYSSPGLIARCRTAPPVGLIPGGGSASRLSPLPFSKELLPIGFRTTELGPRPKVLAHYLLEGLVSAGADPVFWLLDHRKTDIIQYFGSGRALGARLAYIALEASQSVLHTLDAAYPFARGRQVLFGFPDIIFEPPQAPSRLLKRLRADSVDVVLAAVPSPAEQVGDRVALDANGEVQELLIKPTQSPLPHVWMLAAWAPRFSDFLHAWLNTGDLRDTHAAAAGPPAAGSRELQLSHGLEAAKAAGLRVVAEVFPGGSFIDAGTPDGLLSALKRYTDRI
jgi:glucose-1-phosphate thymidylyltransferase